jgi:hypothetical protein
MTGEFDLGDTMIRGQVRHSTLFHVSRTPDSTIPGGSVKIFEGNLRPLWTNVGICNFVLLFYRTQCKGRSEIQLGSTRDLLFWESRTLNSIGLLFAVKLASGFGSLQGGVVQRDLKG